MTTFGPLPPSVSPDSPAVLTLKILFSRPVIRSVRQVTRGRGELLSRPFRDYERRIREQFSATFSGTGFDSRRDIAGIILNRWGHAYLGPPQGFFFGKGQESSAGGSLADLEARALPGRVLGRRWLEARRRPVMREPRNVHLWQTDRRRKLSVYPPGVHRSRFDIIL